MISPLPIYTPTFEGWDDPKRSTFPLQLFGFHYKSRTHSSYGNIDVLQAACRQEVWINPLDAQNAVSRMAIRFASLTIVERCVYPPKSRLVFCRASARWVRAHGIMRIWLAIN
ncbi:dimethyl sulfoxide reductase, subunit A1 [Salmonella enterica subsp. enterica]|uniref:Dimethyl sulfoxide reductase, subunit A1 n=1 Tax=Salmonella enterica I TaxID=59201 RepID=A0A379WA53_SALET|nr:dimethyl sulfoxide reductase, subunit A1 [Salmonella enterica subsp. enterica]